MYHCNNPILDISWWEPLLVKFIRPLVHVYGRILSGLHGSFTSLVHYTMPRGAHLLCLKIVKTNRKLPKNQNNSINPPEKNQNFENLNQSFIHMQKTAHPGDCRMINLDRYLTFFSPFFQYFPIFPRQVFLYSLLNIPIADSAWMLK